MFILCSQSHKNSILNCAFNRNINNAFGDKSIPLREDSLRCFFFVSCYQKVEKTWKKTRLRCFEVENVNSVVRRIVFNPFANAKQKKIQHECIMCVWFFSCTHVYICNHKSQRSVNHRHCTRKSKHETHVVLSLICICFQFGVQSFILSFAHCGQIHWAFTGKIANHSKLSYGDGKTWAWKKREEKERQKENGKGANQKSECTQICYDRSMTTVEGKKARSRKITSAEQKRQMNWIHFEVCWRCMSMCEPCMRLFSLLLLLLLLHDSKEMHFVVLVNLISMMLRQDWLTSIVIARSRLLI